jgi:hypothetical protein
LAVDALIAGIDARISRLLRGRGSAIMAPTWHIVMCWARKQFSLLILGQDGADGRRAALICVLGSHRLRTSHVKAYG